MKKLALQEIIGRSVVVVAAENDSLVGKEGTVVDETRNTITIEQDHATKTLVKDQVTLRIMIDGKEHIINGKMLVGRSEERIKKKLP